MKMIKILAVRQGQIPVIEEMPDTLQAMQQFVGGYLEHAPISCIPLENAANYGLALLCNEDAIRLEFPYNRNQIRGDFFVTVVDQEGEHQSIPDELHEALIKAFPLYMVNPRISRTEIEQRICKEFQEEKLDDVLQGKDSMSLLEVLEHPGISLLEKDLWLTALATGSSTTNATPLYRPYPDIFLLLAALGYGVLDPYELLHETILTSQERAQEMADAIRWIEAEL